MNRAAVNGALDGTAVLVPVGAIGKLAVTAVLTEPYHTGRALIPRDHGHTARSHAGPLDHHRGDQILVMGQYLNQLQAMAERFRAPLITGKTPNDERASIYSSFRREEVKLIIVSKVANFAIDLPSASVAIQISGTFGSGHEEAQRLGRILRPKRDGKSAYFYSVVTEDSREREFASKRQLFLTEQGYRYRITTGAPTLFDHEDSIAVAGS